MTGFSHAWLAEHEAKMAALKGVRIIPATSPDLIEFSIPYAVSLPNTTNGRHWSVLHSYRKRLAAMVAPAVQPWLGNAPIERAKVTIIRSSTRVADADNVTASVKPLLDLLLVRSKTHPLSFGLIRDDDPDHLDLLVLGAKAASRKDQKTTVRIERLA